MTARYVMSPRQALSARHAIAWNEGRITRDECTSLLTIERVVEIARLRSVSATLRREIGRQRAEGTPFADSSVLRAEMFGA